MQVTNVKVTKRESGTLLGFADVEFDGVFTSKNWKIFKGREGRKYDLGFPQEADRKGEKDDKGSLKYWNLVFIDMKQNPGRELIEQIRQAVFSSYDSGGGQPPMRKTDSVSPGGFPVDDAPF